MSKITEMMIRKPSLKYRDVRNYEGEYYDWTAGEHLLKKGTSVNELFHPLENDILFIKDEQVPMRDGVKIMCDIYLPVVPLSSPEGDTIDPAHKTIEAPSGAVGGLPIPPSSPGVHTARTRAMQTVSRHYSAS